MKFDVNRCVIFFSGIDRVGKSTTRKKFAESTNQKYITFDRSPIDNVVYDHCFRHCIPTDKEFEVFVNNTLCFKKVIIVYLTLSFNEINKRALSSEGVEYKLDELTTVNNLFETYIMKYEKMGKKVIRVQCDIKSTDEIINEIKNKIGENNE